MPLYDYECPRCGVFTVPRAISHRDQRTRCDACGRPAVRLVSAPRLNLMSGTRRTAISRNEKSQHEPGLMNRHACGSSCGCGSPRKGSLKGVAPTREIGKLGKLNASRTSKRPWMLGH
jgi:putative FmdB family regulatory protein